MRLAENRRESMPSPLFEPLKIGVVTLKHRIVMAPLTRMRAGQPRNVPRALSAEYYRQRATDGGLIIAEASQVTESGETTPRNMFREKEDPR
jgi:N-ethylmaleimide reductase